MPNIDKTTCYYGRSLNRIELIPDKGDISQQVYDESRVRRLRTPENIRLLFYFPKTFARALGIRKGDILKLHVKKNNMLEVEKTHLMDSERE